MTENIMDYWAMGTAPRPQQTEVLEWLTREPQASASTALIGASTGVGKSGCLMTLAQYGSGIILTPLKQLQDQYRRDWPDVPLLKGSQNYSITPTARLGRRQAAPRWMNVLTGWLGAPSFPRPSPLPITLISLP